MSRRYAHASGALFFILLLLRAPAPGFVQAQPSFGSESTSVAELEDQLARVYELIRDGEFAPADSLARDAVTKAEDSDLPRLRIAHALDALVAVLIQISNATDDEPVELAQRAIDLKEQFPRAAAGERAESRVQMSILQRQRGNYEEVEALLLEALELRSQEVPPDSLGIADVHNELGTLYTDLDDFALAVEHFGINLRISEALLGPEEQTLARKYNHYGRMLYQNAEYGEALHAQQRALEIVEANHGPDHPALGYILNNISTIEEELGHYDLADAALRRALSISLAVYGQEHMLSASIRMNMGGVELRTGDYARALESFESSLPATRASYGEDHRYVAVVLGGLADTYEALGDLDNAESYNLKAIDAFEVALEPDHGDVSRRWYALGMIYQALGHYEEALEWQRKALANRIEHHGEKNLYVAASRHQLGRTLRAMGSCEEASAELLLAREVIREALGPNHPTYADAGADLALVRFAQGRTQESLELALQAESIQREHARMIFRTLPEREALAFAARRKAPTQDLLCSLAFELEDPAPVWDALLRSRAGVLDAMAERQRLLHQSQGSEEAALADAYARAAERYARLLVSGPIAGSERWAEIQLAALEERDAAERALARSSRGTSPGDDSGLDTIRKSLPDHTALIGYFRYRPLGQGCERLDPNAWTARHYLAFVLPDAGSSVRVLELDTETTIDELVHRWMDEARRGSAGGADDRVSEQRYMEAASTLRAVIWDPVAAQLGDSRRILITPEGELHRVHYAALSLDDQRYLAEGELIFQGLSRELDLVTEPTPPREKGLLVAYGDPDFDEIPHLGRQETIFRGETSDCPQFRSMRFQRLPASGQELDEITDLWMEHGNRRVAQRRGADANEASLKSESGGCEILHLATHGFVIADACGVIPGTRGFATAVYTEGSPPPVSGNPLQLSGLALAGANLRDSPEPTPEDGILTAQEIATLDLTGVRWAVLSACDTGGGEVRSGEGVFGLRRAFEIAGAETLIMSLWPVRDEIAREWMVELYRASLLDGASTIQAVNTASATLLERRRAEGGSTHPALWGAFVACGDWR